MSDAKTFEFYRLVKRVYLSASQRVDELLKQHNLARSQFQVLYFVDRAGELAGRELLEKLQVEPATLTGVVDTLEAKGWLQRLEDPADRRAKRLQLTSAGKKLLNKLPNPPAAEVEARMLAGLSAGDKITVKQVLEKMLTNLESGRNT